MSKGMIRVYVEPDTKNGEPAGWCASVEWDGSPQFDAGGPDPLYAAMELARSMAEHIREGEGKK